jgi:hypothetical protein
MSPGLQRRIAHTVAAAALLLLASPLVERAAADEAGDGVGPVFSHAHVTPATLPPEGGSVEVTVDVADPDGVSSVFVEFMGSDGTYQGTLLSQGAGEEWYGGVYLPTNCCFEWPNQYAVSVSATDAFGAYSFESIGDVTVGGVPPFDEAPEIYEPQVTPTEIGSTGGTIAFRATAWDNRNVAEVFATVARPGVPTTQVQMEPVDYKRYAGYLYLPGNETASAQSYEVTMTAIDDIGQLTTIPAEGLTVAAKPPPPPPEEASSTLSADATAAPACVVPRLRGRTLGGARRSLLAAHCTVGAVRARAARLSPRHVIGQRVIGQSPAPGTVAQPGAGVALVLVRPR